MHMPDGLSILIRNRLVLYAMVVQSMRDRIAGSIFGFFFLVLYPLIFLAVYSTVFIYILKVRLPDMSSSMYTIVIFCGLVPFLAFSEAFSVGTSSTVGNAGLVKNIMFPYQLLPAKDAITSYCAMASGFMMLLVASIVSSGFSLSQLLLPVVFLLQVLFTIGLVWITSTINVFFRDLQKMMPVLILFLMMLSPISYTREMMPGALSNFLLFNPISWFIFVYRDILLFGTFPWVDLGIITAFTTFTFLAGYGLTKRLRPMVFDFV